MCRLARRPRSPDCQVRGRELAVVARREVKKETKSGLVGWKAWLICSKSGCKRLYPEDE